MSSPENHSPVIKFSRCIPFCGKLFYLISFSFFSSERPKSRDGEAIVYRLKDWPSGEEFMALMPSRYYYRYHTEM